MCFFVIYETDSDIIHLKLETLKVTHALIRWIHFSLPPRLVGYETHTYSKMISKSK